MESYRQYMNGSYEQLDIVFTINEMMHHIQM